MASIDKIKDQNACRLFNSKSFLVHLDEYAHVTLKKVYNRIPGEDLSAVFKKRISVWKPFLTLGVGGLTLVRKLHTFYTGSKTGLQVYLTTGDKVGSRENCYFLKCQLSTMKWLCSRRVGPIGNGQEPARRKILSCGALINQKR